MEKNPLVPANCVLTDFAFMPLDVRRLLNSETWVLANDSERSAAMCLWLESWHQKPAASVPNNPKMLAHLSKAGGKWGKVKDHVLRGWVDGGDGRLYHPVVAEKALEAWIEKLSNAISGSDGNAKRWQIDIDSTGLKADLADAVYRLKALAPQSKTLNKKIAKTILTPSKPDPDPIAPRLDPESGGDRNRQGEGQRQRQGQGQGSLKDKSLEAFADFEKKRLADFGFEGLSSAWSELILSDWPDLHPDDLKIKWAKFVNHHASKNIEMTEFDWFSEFSRWISLDAPKLIADRKPKPVAKPRPSVRLALAGLDQIMFNKLKERDPTLTQQVIFDLAEEQGRTAFDVLRDMEKTDEAV